MVHPVRSSPQYREYPTRQMAAPLVARGFVRFVNLRPDLQRPQWWICDECGVRVPEARQVDHAVDHG